MILSTAFGTLMTRFGYEKAIDLLAETGFDAIDFTFSSSNFLGTSENPKEEFSRIRAYAEEKGLFFNQAHAPFPSSNADPVRNREIFDMIVTTLRHASYLGVPHIIVHPVQHLTYIEEGNPEKLFEMNVEFYNSLKPYCEEYNIKIALENMWQHRGGRKIVHSTCSRPEEFNRYLDALDSKWFIGCLDVGHAFLVCEDIDVFIEKMGANRLKALHVHDVDGIVDSHTLPYYGHVEWNRVTKALAKIGYTGDFTFEADGFFFRNPNDLLPMALRHMAETGKYLIEKIDGYSKDFATK